MGDCVIQVSLDEQANEKVPKQIGFGFLKFGINPFLPFVFLASSHHFFALDFPDARHECEQE